MQQNLRAKLLSTDKSYIISVKAKILDGRIFLTGKVNSVEDKLKLTKLAWEIKGARSVNNDLQIKEKFDFKRSAKDLLITSQLRAALISNKKLNQLIIISILIKRKFISMEYLKIKLREMR